VIAVAARWDLRDGAASRDIYKGYAGKRPRTWLSLTEAGQVAVAAHLRALEEIAAQGAQTLGAHSAGHESA